MKIGQLLIRPKRAKINRNTEWFGTMDPFLQFDFESQQKISEVCKGGGKQPSWHNTQTFNRLDGTRMYVTLLDHQTFKTHDVIGQAEIDISDVFFKTEPTTRWVEVYHEGKMAATVQIEFEFKAMEPTQSLNKGSGGSLMMSKKSKIGMKLNPEPPKSNNNPEQHYLYNWRPNLNLNYLPEPQNKANDQSSIIQKSHQSHKIPLINSNPPPSQIKVSKPIPPQFVPSTSDNFPRSKKQIGKNPYEIKQSIKIEEKQPQKSSFNQSKPQGEHQKKRFTAEQMDNLLN